MNLSPLLFLIWIRSINLVKSGLRKLKQPKFLMGAILILGYFGFLGATVFLNMFLDDDPTPMLSQLTFHLYIPMGLLVAAPLYWLFAQIQKGHPLGFDKAEIELLFPLPIPRRTLILYRILAVQPRILFTTVIITLFALRTINPLSMVGMYIFISIIHLHGIIISFARTTSRSGGILHFGFAWLPFLLLGGGAILAFILSPPSIPRLLAGDFLPELERITTSGIFPYVLIPYRGLAALLGVGQNLILSVTGLTWGLGILGLHLFWIFVQDVSFEEAAIKGAEARAAMVKAMQKGGTAGLIGIWKARNQKATETKQPFRLAPLGHPIMAYFWKGIIAGGRWYRPRNIVTAGVLFILTGFGIRYLAISMGADPSKVIIVGSVLLSTLGWMIYCMIMFAQSQEGLGMLETMTLYKPLPVPGQIVVAGSSMAEGSVALVRFVLLACLGVGFFSPELGSIDLVIGAAIAAGIMAGSLLLYLTVTIKMCIVMWLPFTAKLEIGPAAFGHNLLVFFIRGLGLLATLMIPGIAAIILGVLFHSHPVVVAIILTGCSTIIGVEIAGLLLLGGWLYDRFDIAAEG